MSDPDPLDAPKDELDEYHDWQWLTKLLQKERERRRVEDEDEVQLGLKGKKVA